MSPLHPRLSQWTPPAGWRPMPSARDGVTVWAPAPEAPEATDGGRYACPRCGATTGFDVAAAAVACPYCGFTRAARTETVGRAAPHEEFTVDTVRAAAGWGVARRELHCGSCGANLAIEAGDLSATCPCCASNEVLVRDAPAPALRPGHVVPFAVVPEQAVAAARRWLGRGWMHPADLVRAATVDGLSGIYLPFWTFSARLASTWEAEVGTERTETYTDADGHTRTQTVIDWSWRSGSVAPEVHDLPVAATERVSRHLLEQLTWDFDALATYTPDVLAGWRAQAHELGLTDAWSLGRARLRERAQAACHADTGSSHVRSFSMTLDLQDERWRAVLLPVYVSAFRYGGRTWRLLVNGQSAAVVGQKPVAWWKIGLAIAAMWSIPTLFLLVGLPLLIVGVGLLPLLVGFGLGVVAAMGTVALWGRATAAERA